MSWTSGTATTYIDFMERLDTFLKLGHNLRPAYTGTGTGTITNILGTAISVQETITVSFSTASAFTVAGTISGALGAGTVGVAFTSAVVGFNTTAGFVSGDSVIFVMTPPWQTKFKRLARRKTVVSSNYITPANAFNHDGSLSTYIGSFVAGYLGCEFNVPVSLRYIAVQAATTAGTSAPRDFTLDWSDNGSSWTTQATYTNQTSWTANESRVFDLGASTGSHAFWRLNITANNNGNTGTVFIGNIYFVEPDVLVEDIFFNDVSFRTQCEVTWRAPGDTGAGDVFVGFKEMFHIGNDAYCWQTYGAAGFDGALNHGNPTSQLRAFYGAALALRNDTIRYWFIATGSYVIVIGNISTVYVSAYLGLLNLYSNSERFTYPLYLASCLKDSSSPARWSTTGDGIHQGFWCGAGASPLTSHLLLNDGTVMAINSNISNQANAIHPGRSLTNLNKNSDGSVPMFPIIIHTTASGGYCAGQIQGMQAISGDGVVSEDTITVNRVTSIAIQGVYETSKTTYAAFELL